MHFMTARSFQSQNFPDSEIHCNLKCSSHDETRLKNQQALFCLLIQHCEPHIREDIEPLADKRENYCSQAQERHAKKHN